MRWKFLGVTTIVLVAATTAIILTRPNEEATAQESQLQSTRVRQGDISLLASGTGTLIVGDELSLGFGVDGSISELFVQVGDEVQAGEVLAVQAERDELEVTVVEKRLSLLDAQQALDDLASNADFIAAQAMLDLGNALDELETAQYNWTVQQQGNRASSSTLEQTEAELELAQSRYDQAEQAHNHDPDNALVQLNYANAKKAYESALATWNWYNGAPTETDQVLLDARLALAKANVAIAQRSYDSVKDGPSDEDLSRADVELAKAQKQLDLAEQNLADSILTAPTAGIILSVSAGVGDKVSGAFINMANLDVQTLEIFLDESDMALVKQGYETDVVFDALPDLTFHGQVTHVDPSLYSTNNLTAIRALVELAAADNPDLTQLMIGMGAAVDVIAGRAQQAVLVPVEALRELSPGEYAVFVLEGGEPKLRLVEVGLQDLTYAEILSGLEVGETVTTGIVETQ
jgi:multidrug efflux pump subunit AcrA (membrane-fusion protein)